MRQQVPDRCSRLLSRQYGVIANWQAEVAGISCRQMRDLVRNGRWQRLQFGVYASFTGEPSHEAILWAAVLRAGPRAILSHETAAELDGLLDKRSKLIHVTVPEPQHRPSVAGIATHRSSRAIGIRQQGLAPPRTMTEETVLDLAQVATSFDDVISLWGLAAPGTTGGCGLLAAPGGTGGRGLLAALGATGGCGLNAAAGRYGRALDG